jgi:hypothetical protein
MPARAIGASPTAAAATAMLAMNVFTVLLLN